MQARFAVLSAMDTYLHSSPAVQRAAVQRWQPIAALFSLLWDEMTGKVALSMVRYNRLFPQVVLMKHRWGAPQQFAVQKGMDQVSASHAFGCCAG